MLNKLSATPFRSILCLNGDLPEKSFFDAYDLPLIAADGAANTLERMGLAPTLIVGDLDSVNSEVRAKNQILHLPNQNSNDYQKSLQYLQDKALLPAIVVGINGGNLDQILNNITIFLETDSVLYAPPIMGCVLRPTSVHQWELPHNTKVSLMGIPNALVSSEGLKWELSQSLLSFPGANSCFNRTQQSSIQIEVHEGAVLALIYTEPTRDAGSAGL